MANPLDLPHQLDRCAGTVRAVIETPAGSRAKFDLDPVSGLFELKGMLPAGMAFPLDFGFIPSTIGEDGDPIDLLLLSEAALPVGALVTVRLIGAIEARQTEQDGVVQRNDRLVGRLATSHAHASVDRLDQLGDGFAEDLKRFFVTYNDLKDKHFEVTALSGAERAVELVEAATTRTAAEREKV